MTTKKELERIEERSPWANKLFINSFMERKKSEKAIIDSFHNLYSFYPEYVLIGKLYEDLEESKGIENYLKLKETIKSALIGGMGIASAELIGLNPNLMSFIGTLAVISGGSKVLYEINKDEIKEEVFTRKEKKQILKDFRSKCETFEGLLNAYNSSVVDYVVDYCCKDHIDWVSEFNQIVLDNKDYIEFQKQKEKFKKGFDVDSILNLHNQLFNNERFNEAIQLTIDAVNKNKVKTK